MQTLLFLCHRLPYPPNKGDKIRSYHVLRYLSERYRVFLGTFIDDPADWAHVPAVQELCTDSCIRPLQPMRSRLRALTGLLTRKPFTVAYYRDRYMTRWVRRVLNNWNITTALAYSSGMAGFLMPEHGMRRVMDFVDVDSDKWRQYADKHTGAARWIYRRETYRLAKYERKVAAAFDASLFVSETEAEFFLAQSPQSAGKVYGVSNGVDIQYWNPNDEYVSPYPAGERVIVFVGAMDYWANVQGAQWFVREVWPHIKRQQPLARFYIVGSNPGPAVQALTATDGVRVIGRVPDVRPYVAHAHLVVAPLQVARGLQNKVLEALAMGKTLLATPQAYKGIRSIGEPLGCVSDSATHWVSQALQALSRSRPLHVPGARDYIVTHYSWKRVLQAYNAVLQGSQEADRSIRHDFAGSASTDVFP